MHLMVDLQICMLGPSFFVASLLESSWAPLAIPCAAWRQSVQSTTTAVEQRNGVQSQRSRTTTQRSEILNVLVPRSSWVHNFPVEKQEAYAADETKLLKHIWMNDNKFIRLYSTQLSSTAFFKRMTTLSPKSRKSCYVMWSFWAPELCAI